MILIRTTYRPVLFEPMASQHEDLVSPSTPLAPDVLSPKMGDADREKLSEEGNKSQDMAKKRKDRLAEIPNEHNGPKIMGTKVDKLEHFSKHPDDVMGWRADYVKYYSGIDTAKARTPPI